MNRMSAWKRKAAKRKRRLVSPEPHGRRLLRADLPPSDEEAKVLADLAAAAAAAQPPAGLQRSAVRGGSWAEITSAAASLSINSPSQLPPPSVMTTESGYISVATIQSDYRYGMFLNCKCTKISLIISWTISIQVV